MIDFPNAPTNGQVYTSGARSWTWDTAKWVASTGAASPITNVATTPPLTGGGSSGAVTIGMTNPLPVANGGTGSTTGSGALTALGAVAKIGDTMTGQLTVDVVATNNSGITITGTATDGPRLRLNNTGSGGHDWRIITSGSGNAGGAGNLQIYDSAPGTGHIIFNTTGNVGIGTAATAPGAKLTVNANAAALPAPAVGTLLQLGAADGAGSTRIMMESFAGSSSLTMRRANGTAAVPSAQAANDELGAIGFMGYGATGYAASARALITVNAAQAWTDANQGTYLTFQTTANNTVSRLERLRIDHSGNVGIGTTGPGAPLDVVGNIQSSGANPTLTFNQSGTANANNISSFKGGNARWQIAMGNSLAEAAGDVGSDFAISRYSNSSAYLDTPFTIRRSNGNVGIGTTGPNYRLHAANAAGANFVAAVFNTSGAAGDKGMVISAGLQGSDTLTKMIEFYDSGPGYQGAIQRNGANAISYTTASDARLKENIVASESGLGLLMSVPVRDFNFVSEPERTRQGLIAQELAPLYPEAVSPGGADPTTDPWSVDYGRLTPLLVKAIQDLKAELDAIKTLKAELDLVKAKLP